MRSSDKNAEALADRLATDEPLRKELESHSRTPEEVETFIRTHGFECTALELREALFGKFAIAPGEEENQMDDSELGGIAGGTDGQPGQDEPISPVLNFHDFWGGMRPHAPRQPGGHRKPP